MISNLAPISLFLCLPLLVLSSVVTVLQSDTLVDDHLHPQCAGQLFKKCLVYSLAIFYFELTRIYIFLLDNLSDWLLSRFFCVGGLNINYLHSGPLLLLTALSELRFSRFNHIKSTKFLISYTLHELLAILLLILFLTVVILIDIQQKLLCRPYILWGIPSQSSKITVLT